MHEANPVHARLTSLAAAAVALVASTAHHASAGGFTVPEVGVRRTAMATIVGRPDDASAIYHNPAGLILSRGVGLYLAFGVAHLDIDLRVKPWAESDRFLQMTPEADGYYALAHPRRSDGVVPMLAMTWAVRPDKLVLGLGAYIGNATGASFDPDGVTRYHLVEGYVIAPQLSASAAVRVTPGLTLGATLGVMNLRVHAEREVYPILSGVDASSFIGTRARLELDGSAWAPSWTIAAFGQPHPRVTWGLTATGRVDATLEGPVEVTFSDDAGTPGDTLVGRHRTSQLLPWQGSAGIAVDATDHLEIDGEFRYWLYRQYEQQRTEVTGIALLRELVTEKHYHDSWAVSAGVRVHDLAALPGIELMAGAQFDRSPAPPETVTLDQPTFSHPGAHAGVRWTRGRYRFGASYVHYWYLVPQIDNSTTSPPSNMRGAGSNTIVTVSVEARL